MAEAKRNSGTGAGRRAAVALAVFLFLVGAVFFFAPDNAYLWIKAMHVIAVISWMAGLLYLPRLFIYHHQSQPGSGTSETLKTMERRLFRVIMNPAMMISWGLGLYLAWDGFGFSGGWLHTKIAAVAAMTGVHVYFGRAMRAFGRDERPMTERGWRFLNEAPALLMIAIVLLVIVKPF